MIRARTASVGLTLVVAGIALMADPGRQLPLVRAAQVKGGACETSCITSKFWRYTSGQTYDYREYSKAYAHVPWTTQTGGGSRQQSGSNSKWDWTDADGEECVEYQRPHVTGQPYGSSQSRGSVANYVCEICE